MTELKKHILEAVESIKKKTQIKPKVGIILGTGLGAVADEIEKETVIPYEEIPHFPLSTVEFHLGRLIFGKLGKKAIVAMQGRFHYYEGYTMKQITFPVRVMRQLGCDTLVVSTACGALNPLFSPGEIMLITDHINLLGDNPLIGENDDSLGPRFPDMSEPYSRKLIALAEQVALDAKIKVQKGVYVAMTGPSLETRAEYRFLRTIGADVVGMSTVPEVIVAVHGGMRVLGLGVITDACLPDALQPIDVKEVLRFAKQAQPKLAAIIRGVIEKL